MLRIRALGGGAARYAQLGARPAERHIHHDLAGGNGAWGIDLGFRCRNSGTKLYLAWSGGSVPDEPASGGPAFRSATTQRAIDTLGVSNAEKQPTDLRRNQRDLGDGALARTSQ
jgi:hypothetical protein